MDTIKLTPLMHRGYECMGIYFKSNKSLNQIVKGQKEARWSQTHRCWYLPLNQQVYQALKLSLNDKAVIDASALKDYLQKKKKFINKTTEAAEIPSIKSSQVKIAEKISTANMQQLQEFIEMLKLKAYSSSTIKTYRNEFLQLLQQLKEKDVQSLNAAQLKRYMCFAIEKLGISENTAHSRLNALKFYYEQVLRKEKFFLEIPRPKKPQLLPKLLNEDEIRRLFNALINKKHKAMLFTAYSAGLRVSEIVNFKNCRH